MEHIVSSHNNHKASVLLKKGNRRRRLRASERSAESAKRENDRTYRGKFFLFKAYDLEFFERESEISKRF
jgi:hypothetical protein